MEDSLSKLTEFKKRLNQHFNDFYWFIVDKFFFLRYIDV